MKLAPARDLPKCSLIRTHTNKEVQYKGGLTLYTLQSRIEFAGWTQANIEGYKGPTPEIVTGLAENVRVRLGSTYCISEVSTNAAEVPAEGIWCDLSDLSRHRAVLLGLLGATRRIERRKLTLYLL
jgi:hypothetical protein